MNKTAKIKLLLPISYAIASSLLFAFTWPSIPQIIHYIGLMITALSFVLWIIARIQLGNAFSLAPKSTSIVKTGLYSKLRHPVYYFSITAVLGIFVYTVNVLVLTSLVLLIVLEITRIRAEEKLLTATYSKEYPEYKKTTWF